MKTEILKNVLDYVLALWDCDIETGQKAETIRLLLCCRKDNKERVQN